MARGGTMTLKSPREIAKMRVAGRVVAQALEAMRAYVRPGVTTAQVDAVGEAVIRKAGATPSFKGLYGFPASVCVAVNDEVVHGIPGKRTLRNGDIIKVDTGAFLDGWHGDATITVPVGEIDEEAQRLVDTTYDALFAGIEQCRSGKRIGDIGHAIQEYAEARGYGIVRQYVGHAIGRRIHEEPQVPNYGAPKRGPRLLAGMTIAIEPMITMGSPVTKTLSDKWTVVTADGSLSAHFEHTVAITADGPRILTSAD